MTSDEEVSAAFLIGKTHANMRNIDVIDSGATLHVYNDLSRFSNFRKSTSLSGIQAGSTVVPILGYGSVRVPITLTSHAEGVLRLHNVAYCVDFICNLISIRRLNERQIWWDNEANLLYRRDGQAKQSLCMIFWCNDLPCLQQKEAPPRCALAVSRRPRAPLKGDGILWHTRMGHPGPLSLMKLGQNSLGVKLIGPAMTDCEACAMAKITRQVSRRPPNRLIQNKYEELHIDWSEFPRSLAGFVRVMFVTDMLTRIVRSYFMTSADESEALRVLKDVAAWADKRNLRILRIRSDNELAKGKRTSRWLRSAGIDFEPSAPRTQAQNGVAERSGGEVIKKARAMAIASKIPKDLWKEVVDAAAYLHNRTPKESLGWRSPFESFHGKKPNLAHLKVYGCKAYAMTENAQEKKNRLRKLDARAYIGYLVGYQSTNIYRIWIPEKGLNRGVISTRDVIFDEKSLFDGKLPDRPINPEVEAIINRIQLPDKEGENAGVLEDVDYHMETRDDQPEDEGEGEENNQPDEAMEDAVEAEIEKEPMQMHEILTPPPENDLDDLATALFNQLALNPISPNPDECLRCELDESLWLNEEKSSRITTPLHGTFAAGRLFSRYHISDLPKPPKTIRELYSHPLKEEFEKAIDSHLDEHETMNTFEEVNRGEAKGHQVLGCMWVFTYKTDSQGYLIKCKARLVVCGNQQEAGELPTRATTLASSAFRALMAIVAQFDLDTIQMDAVNAFVNCHLEETVYMNEPSQYQSSERRRASRTQTTSQGNNPSRRTSSDYVLSLIRNDRLIKRLFSLIRMSTGNA